jgi:hypothetical protein
MSPRMVPIQSSGVNGIDPHSHNSTERRAATIPVPRAIVKNTESKTVGFLLDRCEPSTH